VLLQLLAETCRVRNSKLGKVGVRAHIKFWKLENHCHMLALTMVYQNFCRKHRSLGGKTPAMAGGLTEYVWTVSDVHDLDMWSTKAAAA
jgi:hypothetical protein